jgi:hypothetical protein
MGTRGVLLALLAAAVPAASAGDRFGATASLSAVGGWGWVGGWSGSGWVRGYKALTFELEYGRYRDAAAPDWLESYTLVAGGIGVRRRGSVQPYARVLLGRHQERTDATYDHGLGGVEHVRWKDTKTLTVVGGGFDLSPADGPLVVRLAIEWLQTGGESQGLCVHLGAGLRF